MVAINKSILTFFAAFIAYSSATAQQIQPRIAGLEANERYMQLLQEDNSLKVQEDSITVVVGALRSLYLTPEADSAKNREQIISFENKLFELRARQAMVVDSLNLIEQDWVLNNLGSEHTAAQEQTEFIATSSDARCIYEDPNVKANLSQVDYRNLVKAEEMEPRAEQLSNNYIINYDNMTSLKRSYELTPQQTEANEIRHRFDSLSMANTQVLEQLGNAWSFIYDNKSFAYSLLMELLGFDDMLSYETELMRTTQAEISAQQSSGDVDASLCYLIQKGAMVEYETLVAQKLGLSSAADSLGLLSKKLSAIEKRALPKLSLEERSFIHYEPFEIVSKMPYSSASPIPETAIYESGTIFRILVGSFRLKQVASIFRNTIPLSHNVNEQNNHDYYIGGYATFEDAVEAQTQLKKHGFRAPQIVVWVDGRKRNLTEDPLPIEVVYRIDISDVETLSDGVSEAVVDAKATIAKVGTDKFVVTSLYRQAQVDSLVTKLKEIDPQLNIVVDKSEPEIEF